MNKKDYVLNVYLHHLLRGEGAAQAGAGQAQGQLTELILEEMHCGCTKGMSVLLTGQAGTNSK